MLEVKNLNKTYSSGFALKDIALQVNKGDFLVMFGADDAGKTALLYQVLGLHQFREGEILFEGKPVQELSVEERKAIRFVPDSVCMESVTARDYFAMVPKNYPEYDEEDVQDLCEIFDIDLDTKLTDMTYNENKLTMIIGALVSVPKLLILDEPMNFLTQESSVKLLQILRFLSSRGMTILITCTESSEVQNYCNRYIYLKDGALAYSGLVKEIYGSQKAITVTGGEQSLIQGLLGAPIVCGSGRATYLYNKKKQTRKLTELLGLLGDVDVVVENLTMKEILDKDYTRWM